MIDGIVRTSLNLDLSRPRPLLIGVVHLAALPGAPRYAGHMGPVLDAARADAAALREGGADAVIVENFGDVPFEKSNVAPETVAAMALALAAVGEELGGDDGLPLGVNVLRNDARSALGLAAACNLAFLRVNVHAGAAVTDQGVIEGRAAETVRERARLRSSALILADVHVKHAAPLGAVSIEESAKETLGRGLADGLIVSGRGTGSEPDVEDLRRVRRALPEAPLLVGSGLDERNATALMEFASGAICGTSIKRDGRLELPVDPVRVARLRALLDD